MPEIESLLLANHAESHNGLLYLMGGGWTDVNQVVMPSQPPPPFHFGLGLTILVPWTETNRRHHVAILMEKEDGGDPLMRIEADLETGRPPGAVEGTDQRIVMAFSGEVQFLTPGGYRAVAQLADAQKCASFRVIHRPAQPQMFQQSA
jgi:hypothetical protein